MARAPIIIIGAHRSGTTMLTRALRTLGLFAGARVDVNEEALFFVRFNEWLMARSGATWEHPEPIRELFAADHASDARAIAYACAETITRSRHTLSFLGTRRFLRERRLDRLSFPWGWKDPRNTFTLPLWLRCFPGARAIHLRRHGVDVAHSLTKRHLAAVAAERAGLDGRRKRYLLTPYRSRFFDAVACGSLEGSLGVWQRYATEAHGQAQALAGRALQLRFEDLVTEPRRELDRIAAFCGLDVTERSLRDAAAQMDGERAFAYRRDPALRAFAEQRASLLAGCGYDAGSGR